MHKAVDRWPGCIGLFKWWRTVEVRRRVKLAGESEEQLLPPYGVVWRRVKLEGEGDVALDIGGGEHGG